MRNSARVRYIPGDEEERAHPLHTWGGGRALASATHLGDMEERASATYLGMRKTARLRYIPGDEK
jgi:hypothetical protein